MASAFRRPVVAYPASPAKTVSTLSEARSPAFSSPRHPPSKVIRGRALTRTPVPRQTQSHSLTWRNSSHSPAQRRKSNAPATRSPSPISRRHTPRGPMSRSPSPTQRRHTPRGPVSRSSSPTSRRNRAPAQAPSPSPRRQHAASLVRATSSQSPRRRLEASPMRQPTASEPSKSSNLPLQTKGSTVNTSAGGSQPTPQIGTASLRTPLGSAIKALGSHRRSISEPRLLFGMPQVSLNSTAALTPSSEQALANQLERVQSEAGGLSLNLGGSATRKCVTPQCKSPHFAVRASSGLCRNCSNRLASESGGKLLQVDSFGVPVNQVCVHTAPCCKDTITHRIT